MKRKRRITPKGCGVAMVVISGLLAGCGSGGGGAPAPDASFTPSATVRSANLVSIIEETTAGDVVVVNVAITGETDESDLYGFAFDLVLGDPDVVGLVAGSAEAGDALDTAGCAGVTAQAGQQGDRIVVGVSKLGSCSGNGIRSGQTRTLVRLTLRALSPGSSSVSFGGSGGERPTAVDAGNQPVGTIVFDPAPAFVLGS